MHNDNLSGNQKSRFRKSELELMQKMFEKAPVSICILEGSGHHLKYMNNSFRKLLGSNSFPSDTSAEELMKGMKREEEIVRDRLDMLNRIFTSGEPLVINKYKTHYDRNGNGVPEEAYFNVVYQPMVDESGNSYGIFVAGIEITEHIRAREAADNSEQRLALALKGARMGFWEFNVESNALEYASDQLKMHFGFPLEKEFTYEDFISAIHPEDRAMVKHKIKKGMEESGLYEMEYRIQWPDGSLHWLMGHGNCIYDGQGRPKLRIGITMEITRRKEAEETLREAVKLRDDFLSIAAHELQTPVTSIKVRSELFERQLREDGHDTYALQVGKISSRIDQLSQLTGSLLDISRLRESGLELESKRFNLSELTAEVVEILQHVSTHRIEVEGEPNLAVHADRYRIGQVITNLLVNAVKYSPVAGQVLVKLENKDGFAAVSVIDFGIGISSEDKNRIFESFFKGGGEKNRQTYPGFGIGLYISAQIVERHGGSIRVDDNPGGGSVFTFTLPLADNENSFTDQLK